MTGIAQCLIPRKIRIKSSPQSIFHYAKAGIISNASFYLHASSICITEMYSNDRAENMTAC